MHPADAMLVRSFLEEAILEGQHRDTAYVYCVWSVQGVTSGIFRGAGKQRIGAIFNLVGYYVFGLPIAVSLMFVAKLGIVGKEYRKL